MTNYLEKLIKLDNKIDIAAVHLQVEEVKEIIDYSSRGQILPLAPNKLGFLPAQLANLIAEAGITKKKDLIIMNHLLNGVRQYLSLTYGIWSLPNLLTVSLIKKYLRVNSALEIMAGNAYWSKALSCVGVKVKASDSLEWAKTSATGSNNFMKVENLDAVAAIKKYPNVDLIICSWAPNFGRNDINVIYEWKKSSQAKLLFIGEKDGVTNSAEFWRIVNFSHSYGLSKINASMNSFDFINEKIYEIEKI